MYTTAETPLAKAEYDDRKPPKSKVRQMNYFHIRPQPYIAEYAQLPTFGCQAKAKLRSNSISGALLRQGRHAESSAKQLWQPHGTSATAYGPT